MDLLAVYESQLLSVNETLKHADGSQQADLLDLKSKLEEVIALLGDNLGGTITDKAPIDQKSSIDDEFVRFQIEMSALEGPCVNNDSKDELGKRETDDQETNLDQLTEVVTSLEGTKCRAPFSQPWGEKEYHNALVVSTNFDPDMESVEDIEIEVMFCHPICDRMKPCSFFLSGHCKFSEDKCRFSHGHRVKFSELQEFTLPDYSAISTDSKCLVQSSDGLWYRSTIEKCLDDRQYVVKYDRTGKTCTLDVESLIPLEKQENYCDSDDDKNTENCINFHAPGDSSSSTYAPNPLNHLSDYYISAVALEKHNNGIGSKLMEKMGHIWGQGLGKNSDGRLDPVEAVILPAGKSLDKCIEMRDNCHMKGPISVESLLAIEQDKEEQRAKKAKVDVLPVKKKKETVFDFINSKIAKVKGEGTEIKKNSDSLEKKSKSLKDLNMQVYSVGEDIWKTRKEISKLQKSLIRNSERNEIIRAHVEKKIAAQNNNLKNLQAKERKINQEIKSQTDHRKLAIF